MADLFFSGGFLPWKQSLHDAFFLESTLRHTEGLQNGNPMKVEKFNTHKNKEIMFQFLVHSMPETQI